MIHPVLKRIQEGDYPAFFLIAGPCVIEGEEMALTIGRHLRDTCEKLDIPLVFKGSYRKANRTSANSFKGIGDQKALSILARVGRELNVPVVTDIHESDEAEIAAQYVDVLQIPAFLFRQTALLEAAAATGCVVNIKKGQFAAANAMSFAAEKVTSAGNPHVWLTERGNMFGYRDMVVDYLNIVEMKNYGHPVIMDITHSLQQPNTGKGVTGGRPDMIENIARAALALNTNGLFMETHPDPANAKSDGANMLQLDRSAVMLERLAKLSRATRDIYI